MSYELWAALPKARGSLLVARCVRDWSGILCEIMGIGIRGRGIGFRRIFGSGEKWSEQRYSGKPDGDSRNAQKKSHRDTESPRHWGVEESESVSIVRVQSSKFKVQKKELPHIKQLLNYELCIVHYELFIDVSDWNAVVEVFDTFLQEVNESVFIQIVSAWIN